MTEPNIQPIPVKLKKMDRDEIVRRRLLRSETQRALHRKVWNLRRLVAGDFSQVLDSPSAKQQRDQSGGKAVGVRELYNFMITDFDSRYSNRLLEAVKQTLMSISFAKPDVEFNGLSARLALANTEWVKQQLMEPPIGCGAVDEMNMAMMDFLMGGLGWSTVCMHDGGPALMFSDTLDMRWDLEASTLPKVRWTSRTYRETAAYWLGMFGRKAMGENWEPSADTLDEEVEMEWYHDVDLGTNGSFYVFRRQSGEDEVKDIVYAGDNPWFFNNAGRRVPYLPDTPMFYMSMPSVTGAMGMVEMMFADQLALWDIEAYKHHARTVGKPYYKYKQGSLSKESKQVWEEGRYGDAIETNGDPNNLVGDPGLQVPQDVYSDQAYYDRRLTAKAGLNPYAAGAPVEGIAFASETKEIANQSNLTVGYASEDFATFWTQSTRKLIAAGALYDNRAMEIPIGDAVLRFDATNPIKEFLRPMADIVISADKMAFRPRAQRIAESERDLAIAMKLGTVFPKAQQLAFEEYLRATGKKNVSDYLEMPAPSPLAPGAAGMPGDPAAEAQANTAA